MRRVTLLRNPSREQLFDWGRIVINSPDEFSTEDRNGNSNYPAKIAPRTVGYGFVYKAGRFGSIGRVARIGQFFAKNNSGNSRGWWDIKFLSVTGKKYRGYIAWKDVVVEWKAVVS